MLSGVGPTGNPKPALLAPRMPVCIRNTDHDDRQQEHGEHCEHDDCVCHVSIVPDPLLFVKCVGGCLLVQHQVTMINRSASIA